ncbi:MAG: nucleotidyltransferase family protein [Planctomycetes bacterium]|nr:nucleotidyltransferase family protein [Planctomycetota bacterium]
MGREHGVLALVGAALGGTDALPARARAALKAESFQAAAEHLHRAAQLGTVLGALHAADIDALSFKGPALGERLHPAAGHLRPCADLDLLVRPEDVVRARRALMGLGYGERHRMPSGQEARCVALGKESVFERSGRINVDLHWRLTPPYGPLGDAPESLWRRAETAVVEGHTVRTLGPEDHFLFLCVHGCRHAWSRLRWIVDVALFVRRGGLDWCRLERTAVETGCEHLLRAGLLLAHALLGAPLPAAALAACAADRLAGAAAGWYERSVFADDQPRRRRAWLVLLRSGNLARARELVGALLSPTEAEWSTESPVRRQALRLARALAKASGREAAGP